MTTKKKEAQCVPMTTVLDIASRMLQHAQLPLVKELRDLPHCCYAKSLIGLAAMAVVAHESLMRRDIPADEKRKATLDYLVEALRATDVLGVVAISVDTHTTPHIAKGGSA